MSEFIAGACLALLLVWLWPSNPRDDTDPPGGRSNLRPLTDHKTGLQYLATVGGGITPRLDLDGKHMRAHPKAED
jgi:hypothetical protein